MNTSASLRLLLVLIAATTGCSDTSTPTQPKASRVISLSSDEIELVQSDVSRLANAGYAADVATVLSYTHPKVIEAMGGTSAASANLQEAFSQAQALGMTLDSLTFPEPPTFIETDKQQYAIVPTLSLIDGNGQRVESLNFQFGARPNQNARWKFMEGSRVTSKILAAVFPDFPAEFELPKYYRKPL